MKLSDQLKGDLLSFAYYARVVSPIDKGKYVLITCARGERPTRRLSLDETSAFVDRLIRQETNGRA